VTAMPSEGLLPETARWMATLPLDVQPAALTRAFPSIANTLAELWGARPDALRSYVNELLVDRRKRRRRYSMKFSRELQALRAYHASVHLDRDRQRRAKIASALMALRPPI
jgi:hypothetical protein